MESTASDQCCAKRAHAAADSSARAIIETLMTVRERASLLWNLNENILMRLTSSRLSTSESSGRNTGPEAQRSRNSAPPDTVKQHRDAHSRAFAGVGSPAKKVPCESSTLNFASLSALKATMTRREAIIQALDLAFPTVLIGLLVYAFITYRGPLGEWGLLFTLPGMAIGQTLLALPIVVSWVAQAVEGLDPRCRQTLLTLGARSLQLAWLSLCEVRFAIAMVCLTAFGRVITEVGIAMMLGGNVRYHTRTMTTAIALETSKGEFAQGIALGLVLLFMAFAINVLMTFIKHRGRI